VDPDRLRSRLRHYVASARQAGRARQQRFYRAEQRDADKGDDFRLVAANLAIEDPPALHILGRPQIVDPWTRSGNQIRDAEPELREARIIDIRDRLGHQTRFRQQLPEAIREPGEMMTGLCGTHAGIDADEEHAHAGPDAVLQAKVRPIHETIQP
jgi:hypothetical protein